MAAKGGHHHGIIWNISLFDFIELYDPVTWQDDFSERHEFIL
jgi:hypothetical protein